MNLNLVYYSPTGTTKNVVKTLSDSFPTIVSEHDITLVMQPLSFNDNDIVIIGIPVYSGRVPRLAKEKTLKIKGGNTLAILIATYGNRHYDDSLLELKNIVQANGFHVFAAAAFATEHSVVRKFGKGRPDNTGKRKAMSEKIVHGKNGEVVSNIAKSREPETPMAGKLAHDEMLKASHPLSEKLSSEKPLSEKMVHGNFGQANIKNNSTTNSFSEKEQVYYHQGLAPDDKKPVLLFSLERAKELMRYDYWHGEAMAWGELKETLGHFFTPADKTWYLRRVSEILEEIAKQVCTLQEAERIATVAESEAFTTFFENVLTHWDEIRSVKGYVKASMKNIINGSVAVFD